MDDRPVEGPGGRPFAGRWRVRTARGPAAVLLERDVPVDEPTVWLLDVARPALVLGSTQPAPAVDGPIADVAGVGFDVDVVRRRSGGGAVFVRPESVLWVDMVVPAGDPVWDADVGRAFWWLGDVWAAVVGGDAHRGPLVRTRWSDAVCFAGLGPGEVMIDGRKAVGISQRRWRDAALFQCAALLAWDYEETARLTGAMPADLRDVARAVDVGRAALTSALLIVLGDV